MVTIITKLTLKEGAERDWDAAMRDRMAGAAKRPGWIGGQLLKPDGDRDKRLIIGTWRTREHWKKWHGDPRFAETRRRLEGLVAEPEEHTWYAGVIDARPRGAASASAADRRAPKKATPAKRGGDGRGRDAPGGASRGRRNGRARGGASSGARRKAR